jgi:hypothetical protein
MIPSLEKDDPAIDQRRRGPAESLEGMNVAPRDGSNTVRDQPSLASLIHDGYRHSLAQARRRNHRDDGDLPSQRNRSLELPTARPNNGSVAGSRLRTALESAQRTILDDWEPDDDDLNNLTGDDDRQPEQSAQRNSQRNTSQSGPRLPGVDPAQ